MISDFNEILFSKIEKLSITTVKVESLFKYKELTGTIKFLCKTYLQGQRISWIH